MSPARSGRLTALAALSTLVALIALVALIPGLGPVPDARAENVLPWPAGGLTLDQGQLAIGDDADEPEPSDWTPVSLPDTWAHRKLPGVIRARYRLQVDLPPLQDAAWALRIDRLSTHHEVRINGALVHGRLSPPPATLRRPVPTLVPVPGALLIAGTNEIDILVDHGSRGGLSTVVFGPITALERDFLYSWHRAVQWPHLLNVGCVGACLVGLLIWWRRRKETALGVFSVLGGVASIRNLGYFSVDSGLPVKLSDLLFFEAQVGTAVLLGLFTLSISRFAGSRRLRWTWIVGGLIAALLGLAGVLLDRMQLARALVYPFLLVSVLAALWQGLPAARRLHGTSMAVLLATLGLVFVAGVHDYLYQQGYTSVMDWYWMPWAVPPAILAFNFLLVRRVVDAMNGIEQLAVTLEDRVRARTAELEEANAAKGRFVAAASHDLRQPVATIGLLVGLIREQASTPMLRDLAARVDQAAMSLETLLKGLLDLSRLEAGAVQPRIRRVALQPLFDSIAAHELEAARARGIRLHFRATRRAVVSDPVLLEQILRNLVGNAVRCTSRGGVLVAVRGRGRELRVQVWDTGPGMTPEQQRRAFDAFVQFDTPGRRGQVQGLGLGLAIVQRSARLLDHPLELRSVPGRGTCFTLRLPAERRSIDRETAAALANDFLAGRRVLLVEDDPDVREAMLQRLREWGVQTDAFAGLRATDEAIAAGRVPPPDLVITDMRLPDGDGLAVIEHARARWPRVPALVITGNTLPTDLAQLERSGVPVLHKPFRAEALLAALRELAPADVEG